MADKILSEENINGDYLLRTVLVDGSKYGGGGDDWEMETAYTLNGEYIGDEKTAKMFAKKGIKPQLKTPDSNVCSIGFCEADQKWFGWSHRAMYGFGIGAEVKVGDCAYTASTVDELYIEHMKWYSDFKSTGTPVATRDYENNCLVIEHKMVKRVDEEPAIATGVNGLSNPSDPDPEPSIVGATVVDEVEWEPAESDFQRIYTGRGEWIAETLEDARQMAIDFADSVS